VIKLRNYQIRNDLWGSFVSRKLFCR